jgi:hypothetical protein
MRSNTASDNTAVGMDAMWTNTTGSNNTAMGFEALRNNIAGANNLALGYGALRSSTGSTNTAVGVDALRNSLIGTENTGVGFEALYSTTTGNQRTALGVSANSVGAAFHNSTGLGYNADCTTSNQVIIGNASVGEIGGYEDWSNVSDSRFKTDIAENVPGIAFIQRLRPVTYHIDLHAIDDFFAEHYNERDPTLSAHPEKEQFQYTGFIAQEVEAAAESIGYDFRGVDAPKHDGDFYSLRYATFVVPLVKAVQELSVQNAELQEQLIMMQTEINELKVHVNIEQRER